MSIESLLTTKVIEAVKQCYDADVDKDKVQLQATRKEFAGDLTVVVFPFTRFSKKSPEETGKELGGYLKQHIEEIKDYNVVKGFLNIEISAAYWFVRIRRRILDHVRMPAIFMHISILRVLSHFVQYT